MKRKTIFMIIGILILIASITGVAFAYFAFQVQGTGKDNVVTTAQLSLTYNDGNLVEARNVVPGDTIIKTFSVESTSNVATEYTIYMSDLLSDFTDKTELEYVLVSIDGGKNTVQKQLPVENDILEASIPIEAGATHNYELRIIFLNKNYAQNYNQGKTMSFKIQINDYSEAIPPEVPNNLTASNVTTNSVSLNWGAATDENSQPQELMYYLCQSTTNNITVDNCKSTAIVSGNNIVSYNVTNLLQNTTYYFNVVVENRYGLNTMYNLSSVTTEQEIVKWGEKFEISGKNDLVGIIYSTWFDYMHDKSSGIYNITNILAGYQNWGNVTDFHYWAEPELGYYSSMDRDVIRTHLTQIYEAGIDFIIIDNTNVLLTWIGGTGALDPNTPWYRAVTGPMLALFETAVEMREEGLPTPYFVNWVKTDGDYVALNVMHNLFTSATYDPSLNNARFEELWVYWNDKPFFLTTEDLGAYDRDITGRVMWGLQPSTSNGEWTYLQKDNRTPYGKNLSGGLEQMGVSVAMQQNRMSNTWSATGRNNGETYGAQWYNAYNYRPKVLTITWWNEWGAERIDPSSPACTTYCFTDNYTQEYSRDIEPMKGGHGDQYYQWTKQYITNYKNHTGFVKYTG